MEGYENKVDFKVEIGVSIDKKFVDTFDDLNDDRDFDFDNPEHKKKCEDIEYKIAEQILEKIFEGDFWVDIAKPYIDDLAGVELYDHHFNKREPEEPPETEVSPELEETLKLINGG